MDIKDLIDEVGDVDVQFLDQSALNFKRMKDHNRITFVTEEDFGLKGAERFGVIVWMDREKAQAAFDKARAKKAAKGDK